MKRKAYDVISPSFELELDQLVQHPRINTIYTQLLFCFRDSERILEDSQILVASLNEALITLSKTFPWTSGSVFRDGSRYVIKDCKISQIKSTDLRTHHNFPTYATLSDTHFPFKWLDEAVLCSRQTIAKDAEVETGLPVFQVQLNVLEGGFILSFDSQHGSMDMAAQVQLVRLFAKAYRREAFTTEEISVFNMERNNTIPLFNELTPPTASTSARTSSTTRQKQMPAAAAPNSLTWAYFRFPVSSLEELKADAMAHVTKGSFVSTDDVLSAFIWQLISRIRAQRLDDLDLPSTLSRNVDGRACLFLPATYPGLMVTSTICTRTLASIANESLAGLASELRTLLAPSKIKRQLQEQATQLARGQHGSMQPQIKANVALDVRLSSWAKEKCYNIDFGGDLGLAEAVRTPRFVNGAREGLVYFLPKERNGGIVVGLCLRRDDMTSLQNDSSMIKWAEYIG